MTSSALPDPGPATTLDELAAGLRALKVWAGDPAYGVITARVNAGRPASDQVGRTTVVDCFRAGRRRLDGELVAAVVHALHPDTGYVTQWRQALRVINGETRAAAQVRVQAGLPEDLPGFTGRAAELAYAREAGIPVLVGMAGVGKTRLAVHLGHELLREQRVDRVFFVDLRGFHPDPAQPPADPAAVLDGFLRLLGVSGQQIPYGLAERAAVWRDRLAGSRTLVVLDNAAGAEQVRPLLPGAPGCVTLVTSRRRLPQLPGATHCDVDVFRPADSHRFLDAAMPGIPAGDDPDATARIAQLCGQLPLALALVAGHMRAKGGWTLTDHADWLEERHGAGRLDTGVELALDVSYRELPDGERALLRGLALHPGQDVGEHAAAALSGTTVEHAAERLAELAANNLVQPAGPGRYTLHDLVRAYAAARAADEDRRSERREAVTRLLDFYLATAAEAMNRLDPAEAGRRPKVSPSPVARPALDEPVAWLDNERTNLVAAAVHAEENGLPAHAVQFSAVLFRYLIGGHHLEAMTVHERAARAAERTGDLAGQATALAGMATAEVLTGRHEAALARLGHALQIFQVLGDVPGQARTLNTVGITETRLGRYETAARHLTESMNLHGTTGNAAGQARARTNLANLESRLGRDEVAVPLYEAVLRFHEEEGDKVGEAVALSNLGGAEVKLGRYDAAERHLDRALDLDRELRNAAFEASTLDFLGTLWTGRGDSGRAVARHQEAMTIFRRLGDRHGEACAHNGLGEAALVAGRVADAIAEHTAAYGIAAEPGVTDPEQQARARTGLGHAWRAQADPDQARREYERARALWASMSSTEAARITAILDTLYRKDHE